MYFVAYDDGRNVVAAGPSRSKVMDIVCRTDGKVLLVEQLRMGCVPFGASLISNGICTRGLLMHGQPIALIPDETWKAIFIGDRVDLVLEFILYSIKYTASSAIPVRSKAIRKALDQADKEFERLGVSKYETDG